MARISDVRKIEEGRYAITSMKCPKCQTVLEVEVTGQQLFQLNQGAFMADATPELSPEQAERFISGFCGPCWLSIFMDEDEPDEDEGLGD
jgi:hypothetical protein